MPARDAVACSATSRQSRLPSSSPASVSVPGVTMRVTLRSTGPLLVAGSPICSQIATDSPEANQLGEILLDRVIGHAGHRDRRARRLAARGQRDVEQRRRALRIAVEKLVEIAHAVEHELVRMLRLDAQILLHHRRVRRIGAGGFGWRQFVMQERAANRPNRP